MAQKTRSQLATEINVIRNETESGGNTATRVANTLQDVSDSSALLTEIPSPVKASGTGITGEVEISEIILGDNVSGSYDSNTKKLIITSSSVSIPSWHRTIIDFRTLASQTLIGSPPTSDDIQSFTLGGIELQVWHPVGFYTSVPFCVRNVYGKGLQIGYTGISSGSSYNIYQRISMPRIVWPFTNWPQLTLMTPMRAGILVEDSAINNYPTSEGGLRLGIGWQDNVDTTSFASGYYSRLHTLSWGIQSTTGKAFSSGGYYLYNYFSGTSTSITVANGFQGAGWNGVLGIGCNVGAGVPYTGVGAYTDFRYTPDLTFPIQAGDSTYPTSVGEMGYTQAQRQVIIPASDVANWGVEIGWQGAMGDSYWTKYVTVAGLMVDMYY